ncbi:hypothetical protein QL285_066836 [Trifolium repens]|nr:hypothetical protein QL285_066836 [Trifolium repens]
MGLKEDIERFTGSNDYGLWKFEVESSKSGRLSTLTLGYLIGDREESCCVEPKGNHGDLVGNISIVAEEVQGLERIFREAIENNLDQTMELVGLLEIIGCKGSLMLQLVEPPKIPSGRQDLHESGRHSEDEGEEVMLAGSKWRLTPRSWSWPVILDEDSRWREHTVVEWITIDLKARWRIVGYALKSQSQEVRKILEESVSGAARRPYGVGHQEATRKWFGLCHWRGARAREDLEIFLENIFFWRIL